MLLDQLFERVNTRFPGSNRVVDLRNPAIKSDNTETHITLTKDGGALLWAYPNGIKGEVNRLKWRDEDEGGKGLLSTVRDACDKELQPDEMGIRYTPKGVQISLWRDNGTWTGNRNRFSLDMRPVVERLLDLGIVTPRTPIFLGNWARREEDGELVGSVAGILKAPSIPNKIMLYHGTTNARAVEIEANGLAPVDKMVRTQKEKIEADHRPDCVYLTASMSQAEYYANKALKIDRQRLTYNYTNNLYYKLHDVKGDIEIAKRNGDAAKEAKATEKFTALKRAYELVKKMHDATDKVEPVILGIELTRADYKHLLADDDYLMKKKNKGEAASVDDWRDSLSDFGQVAYRGTIPPSKIKRVK